MNVLTPEAAVRWRKRQRHIECFLQETTRLNTNWSRLSELPGNIMIIKAIYKKTMNLSITNEKPQKNRCSDRSLSSKSLHFFYVPIFYLVISTGLFSPFSWLVLWYFKVRISLKTNFEMSRKDYMLFMWNRRCSTQHLASCVQSTLWIPLISNALIICFRKAAHMWNLRASVGRFKKCHKKRLGFSHW